MCPINTQDIMFNFLAVTTKFIQDSNDTAIFCNIDISDYANLTFTIDTEAMTSIIKSGKIRRGTMISRNNTQFKGLIKGFYVKAIGKITTSVYINRTAMSHEFYIINDDINLKNDGILGLDFLKAYKEINYSKNEMKLILQTYAHIIQEKQNMDLQKTTLPANVSTVDNQNNHVSFIDEPELFTYSEKNEQIVRKDKRRKKRANKIFFAELPDDYFREKDYPTIRPSVSVHKLEIDEYDSYELIYDQWDNNKEDEPSVSNTQLVDKNEDKTENHQKRDICIFENREEPLDEILNENALHETTDIMERMEY